MDTGKREDRLLDTISDLIRNRNATEALIAFYVDGELLTRQVGDHLLESLKGEAVGEGVAQ